MKKLKITKLKIIFMFLIINTTNNEFILLILAKSQTDFKVKKIKAEFKQSERLLSAIAELLKKNNINLTQLKGLGVVSGPGGFTSLRIGVVTANTLAYALKIPVVGIKRAEFENNQELIKKILAPFRRSGGKFILAKNIILPFYGGEPNISYPSH